MDIFFIICHTIIIYDIVDAIIVNITNFIIIIIDDDDNTVTGATIIYGYYYGYYFYNRSLLIISFLLYLLINYMLLNQCDYLLILLNWLSYLSLSMIKTPSTFHLMPII